MKKGIRWLCLFLVVGLLAAIPAQAATAVEPRASNFFSYHDVALEKATSSTIKIRFDVDGVSIMSELGASTIHVYRSADGDSWTKVRTFSKANYTSMVGTDTVSHYGYVTYTGAWSGYYYRASVTLYAKKNGSTGQLTLNTDIIRM